MTRDELAHLLERLSAASEADAAALAKDLAPIARDWQTILAEGLAEVDEPEATHAEIAAYVDGRIGGADRDAFEARLLASPNLRGRVDDLAEDVAALDRTLKRPARPPANVVGEATLEGLRASLTAGQPLTMAQQRALFTDTTLRAEYNRMVRHDRLPTPAPLRAAGSLSMSARIAASSDEVVNDRTFPGGSSHIAGAGRPNLLQIRLRVEGKSFAYDALELQGPDGTLAYLALPRPNAAGEITRIVDLNKPADAEAVALLRNPLATGMFRSLGSPSSS